MGTALEVKVWKAAPGAGFSNEKAQVYGECIEALCESMGGPVPPKAIVKEARKKRSPLHKAFEWDDGVAAEQYRLEQARHIAHHIDVVIEMPTGEPQVIRNFHSVQVGEEGARERGYVTLATVQEVPDYYQQVIADALRMLRTWRHRYGQYSELESTTPFVDKAIEEIERRNGRSDA